MTVFLKKPSSRAGVTIDYTHNGERYEGVSLQLADHASAIRERGMPLPCVRLDSRAENPLDSRAENRPRHTAINALVRMLEP